MNPTFLLKLHVLTGLWFNVDNSCDVKFSWTSDEHHPKAVTAVEELEKAGLIVVYAMDHSMGTMRGKLTDLGFGLVNQMAGLATFVKVIS